MAHEEFPKIIENPPKRPRLFLIIWESRDRNNRSFHHRRLLYHGLPLAFSPPRGFFRLFPSAPLPQLPLRSAALARRLICAAPIRFSALRRRPVRSVGRAVEGGVGTHGVDSLPFAPASARSEDGGAPLHLHNGEKMGAPLRFLDSPSSLGRR